MINVDGLATAEAAQRLLEHGPNELESARPKTLFAVAVDTVREPMFLILLACSVLYLMLGDLGEALLLSFAIFVVMFITFVQERRTERTLSALRDMSSPRARVLRDGVAVRIAGRDVVPGDVVLLAEGDRVPADGFVLESQALKLNESLLTGESVPVSKTEWNGSDAFGQPGGEDTAFVFSGTLVVQGSGKFWVRATGTATAMGRIGTAISSAKRPQSTLQVETRRVVRVVALTSLLVSVVIAGIWWLRDGDFVRGVLMGLTFAMSTIPEEFPVVLTVFMALGAWRISRKRVLTRQMNAVEALGAATFLCVDKTGTLTENRMTLQALWCPGFALKEWREADLEGDGVRLEGVHGAALRVAALASDPHGTDPMDLTSIKTAKAVWSSSRQDFWAGQKLTQSYPLVRPLLAVGFAWTDEASGGVTVFAKGAVESILELCPDLTHQSRTFNPELKNQIMTAAQRLAAQGYRVLALAEAPGASSPATGLRAFAFKFVGLACYNDPVKVGVPESVQHCHRAGIKVMMITGDYPATALSVAQQIGLQTHSDVLRGDELDALNEVELAKRLETVRVLARMVPEHKLRVVQALRMRGEVVAMTGDGVNDAPALKAAHIGIAMGGRGTDVAREAAGLVLLQDDFTSIVDAVALGRRIYNNLQKAVSYIIAIHVPIVGLTLIPLGLGLPPILWPVHLAFLELVIDPVCSIVFEAEPAENSIMEQPPRSQSEKLFGLSVLPYALLCGALLLATVFAVYVSVGKLGETPDHARALAFATLIMTNVVLILTLRSRSESAWSAFGRKNPTLLWVGVAIFAMAATVLHVPGVVELFHFDPPHMTDLLLCAVAALLCMAGFELMKFMQRVAGRPQEYRCS